MRVLLVEDMDDLREAFAWLLRFAGCEVAAVSSGSQALARVSDFTPGLVLADFMMPEMDGVELIRRLRSLPGLERVPMIIVTANGGIEVVHQALAAGAAAVIGKPFDVLDVLARFKAGDFDVT